MERQQSLSFSTDVDKDRTMANVKAEFETYRMYEYLSFQRREASLTASYSDMRKSEGVTSDQTGSIATYNVDEPERRKLYCESIREAVEQLPELEKAIIKLRYMDKEADYITDQIVYQQKLAEYYKDPTMVMSFQKYDRIRWRAFSKLADWLGVKEYKSGSNFHEE